VQLRPGTAPEHYPVRNEKPSPILGLAGSLPAGRGRRRGAWPARHQSSRGRARHRCSTASFARGRSDSLSHRTFFSRVQFYLLHTRARFVGRCLRFALYQKGRIISAPPAAVCVSRVCVNGGEKMALLSCCGHSLCSLFNLASPLSLVPWANICCVSSCCYDPKAWVAT
jgi:hypothetical protein